MLHPQHCFPNFTEQIINNPCNSVDKVTTLDLDQVSQLSSSNVHRQVLYSNVAVLRFFS